MSTGRNGAGVPIPFHSTSTQLSGEPVMERFLSALASFAHEEDGAQVIEYALIIAVVSIALVVALRGITNGNFSDFIARVNNCLTTSTCA
jgi:pilus assembly protein Flp/PilA